ncbi:hypothetical protein GCM10027160_12730 [Streptomyces calidiresistens]|uniref:Uncharacterized protein n=1 Tax=Streptomyces calidiresistens TaxID=1485586 RepID=A0A7W3T0E3_9ACTN|nr:hypothetical protein [Streptomyces calidiresistens]MBB0228674.1 hypothetical protein [Streptomyces calidiresistens]
MERRIRHGCGALALGLLLTVGCTAETDEPDESAGGEVPGVGDGEGPGIVLAAERLPVNRAQAVELAETIMARPETFGPGFVGIPGRGGDPGEWAVLDENCVWVREPVPDEVLASVTGHAELPAEEGAGPLGVSAVVTVHRDARSAEWEMARTVEDALRCPDQQLRPDEWVSGLISVGMEFGAVGNFFAEDFLIERGSFHGGESDEPHDFEWARARIGPLTVAVSAKGAEGRTGEEVGEAATRASGLMLSTAERELAQEPAGPDAGEGKKR